MVWIWWHPVRSCWWVLRWAQQQRALYEASAGYLVPTTHYYNGLSAYVTAIQLIVAFKLRVNVSPKCPLYQRSCLHVLVLSVSFTSHWLTNHSIPDTPNKVEKTSPFVADFDASCSLSRVYSLSRVCSMGRQARRGIWFRPMERVECERQELH